MGTPCCLYKHDLHAAGFPLRVACCIVGDARGISDTLVLKTLTGVINAFSGRRRANVFLYLHLGREKSNYTVTQLGAAIARLQPVCICP